MPKKDLVPSLRIHVEQEHIDNAQRKNSYHCMIADALRDAMPEAKFISVDLQSIRFTLFDVASKTATRYFYFTPTLAQHALLKFDQGVKVRTFDFTARSGIMKTLVKRDKKDKTKRSHASKGIKKHIVRKEREFGIRMFETVETKPKMPRLVKNPNAIRTNASNAV